MTGRIEFVHAEADIRDAADDGKIVMLDPAWVAGHGDDGVFAMRDMAGEVAAGTDLFDDALVRLDEWAAGAGLIDILTVDDVSYWFRARERLWSWLHERLVWASIVDRIAAQPAAWSLAAPPDVAGLLDVARAAGIALEVRPRSTVPASRPPAPPPLKARRRRPVPLLERLLGRRAVPAAETDIAGRERHLRARIAALVEPTARRSDRTVLVLSHMGLHQTIGAAGTSALRDPNLGAVTERLADGGHRLVTVGLGVDHRRDDDWEAIRSDPALIPHSILRRHWPAAAAATDPVASILAALDDAPIPPLRVHGIDLAEPLVEEVRSFVRSHVVNAVRQVPLLEAVLDDVRPDAILLTHEGIRTPWLVAARHRAIPTIAVQHGILYPSHPGYCSDRHERRVLPDRTCVYGDYDRRVLLEHGGYLDGEVVVTGSPRLEMTSEGAGIDTGTAPIRPAPWRAAVRRDLGVADGDRMLVISTTFLPLLRDFHLLPMLARVLGGPLPGVHVVFKQHPGETEDGPYERLLLALARAGGYEPPRMTVVRRIDLYALLGAADAHLGMHSTVLTDAVAAGTPNLIATVDGRPDLLDYVSAGVAHPVHDRESLLAALADGASHDPARRAAFLADHYLPGNPSERIVAEIAGLAGVARRP